MREKSIPVYLKKEINNSKYGKVTIKQIENNKVEHYFNGKKIDRSEFENFLLNINFSLTKKYIEQADIKEFKKVFDYLWNAFENVRKKNFLQLNSMEYFSKKQIVKFNTVNNFFYTDEELKKMRNTDFKYTIDGDNAFIETALMYQQIFKRPLLLYGTSGSGKTTGIRKFCYENNLQFRESIVSTKENLKESLFGTINLAPDENGQLIAKKVEATGFEALDIVRELKETTYLLLDEINRTEDSLKEFTLFSPVYNYQNKGDFYFINTNEELEVLLVENLLGKKGILLKGKKIRSVNVSSNTLKVLPENATIEQIRQANGCGNVSVINSDYLKKKELKIIKKIGYIQDTAVVPVEGLRIIATANIGNDYDTVRFDTATIQRCIAVDASSYKRYKGKEILSFYRKNKQPVKTKIRPFDDRELELLKLFLEKFSEIWGNYCENGQIPKTAYNERLFSTLENIRFIPEKIKDKNMIKETDLKTFLKQAINEYLISNFVTMENGNENVEFDEEELKLLSQTIEEIFEHIKTDKKQINFDINKEFQKEVQREKTIKKAMNVF